MKIGESLRRKGKEEVIIKSIIWNSIINIFKSSKNIDITSYLVSINLKGKTVLVKTTKPIIKTELLMLDEEIKKASKEKLIKIGIKIYDFNIKYI